MGFMTLQILGCANGTTIQEELLGFGVQVVTVSLPSWEKLCLLATLK
jgi:hypothetical protein